MQENSFIPTLTFSPALAADLAAITTENIDAVRSGLTKTDAAESVTVLTSIAGNDILIKLFVLGTMNLRKARDIGIKVNNLRETHVTLHRQCGADMQPCVCDEYLKEVESLTKEEVFLQNRAKFASDIAWSLVRYELPELVGDLTIDQDWNVRSKKSSQSRHERAFMIVLDALFGEAFDD